MRAGMAMTSPQSPSQGLGVKHVLIRSIDMASDTIYATDANGAEIQLPRRIRRVGIPAAVGQTWLADTSLGFWSLAAFVESADGLRTAPSGSYTASASQFASALAQPLSPSAPWAVPSVSFPFVNPSPVWQMRVAAWVHARMTCNMSANSGAFLLNTCQFAGSPVNVRNSYTPLGNPTAGAINGLRVSSWNTAEIVVAPGATAQLNAACTASAISSAAVTLTEWVVWVEFIAWLIDPTQPGGIAP